LYPRRDNPPVALTQGMALKLLFVVIGALVGCALGSASAALAMAVLGGFAGWWWSARAAASQLAKPELDVATLVRRVSVLEQQVGQLREAVRELRAADLPSAAATAREPAAVPVEPVAPPRPAMAAPTSVPAAASAPVAPVRTPAPAPAPRPVETDVAATATTPAPVAAPRRVVPPPPAVPLRDRLPPVVARWIFGGNTIVKIGVLILFLGLAFLLRYTAERVTVPVQFRYMGVALVGVVLTFLGWRLRDRQNAAGDTGYGLILQGAGIGVFYLTALGALHLDPLLSANAAFAFMALVSAFGALLAVKQDAPWLAFVSIAEGFAAPVLVGGGNGAYAPLMTYMALLDTGILAMAWFKAWRPLNLVGAVSTSALAGAWAHLHYTDADYAGVQAFLVFFFLLFTVTGVLFARRALAAGDAPSPQLSLAARAVDALHQVGRVDSTLTFGVPLAAFSLQYLLVRDMHWGPAWAACAFAFFHILLGGALMRGRHARYALLGEAHVIVGTIFGTLAIPLALQGAWTGATWAIEASGMYWLGARQRRTYARAFALVVMLGAALRLVGGLSLDLRGDVPLVDGSALGVAMLAAALCAVDAARRRMADAQRGGIEQIVAAAVPFAASFAFATLAWMLCPMLWAGAITAWIAYGCAALTGRLAAPTLRVASVLLHLGALTAMTVSLQITGDTPAPGRAWQDLVAALLIGVALLATGWLGLRDAWRAAAAGSPRPVPIASSVGLVVGLGVASASLLFRMAPADAALAWPIIGLAAAWIGTRLRAGALVGSGIALQLAAGAAGLLFGPSLWNALEPTVSIASTLWLPLLLTTMGLVLGDLLRGAATAPPRAWWHSTAMQWVLVAWSLFGWSRVLPPVVWRALQASTAPAAFDAWPHWQLIWLTLTAVAAAVIARWRDWRVLGQATLITVPLWILAAAAAPHDVAPSANLGWVAWPLALLAHPWLLRTQAPWRRPLFDAPLQLAGWWLFIALAARECVLRAAPAVAPHSAWGLLAAMAVPAVVLVASVQPSLLRRWKTGAAWDTWLHAGCGALALYLFGWLWVGNASAGNAAPLPWLPLLNPLEIGAGVALLAIVGWVRALPAAWRERMPPTALPAVLGVTAFGLVTGMVLRTCHHWAGVAWDVDALYASRLTQAALSVAWSLIGVALMLAGHRRRRRVPWIVGAALLGVVVVKLFLVELADRGSLSRIVSFLVVGGLMLAVGYFAPMPPRRDEAKPAAPDAQGEPA
jgi:uncharacterized membrane protein